MIILADISISRLELHFIWLSNRLTGVYLFILCLHYTLIGAFQVSSPQLKSSFPGQNFEQTKQTCQNVWWKNLLYIGIYDFGLDPVEYPILGVGICVERYICYPMLYFPILQNKRLIKAALSYQQYNWYWILTYLKLILKWQRIWHGRRLMLLKKHATVYIYSAASFSMNLTFCHIISFITR